MKTGRPEKHYVTTTGETIVGLLRRSDGRWQNKITGERWTQPDERLAVQKFRLTTDTRPKFIGTPARTPHLPPGYKVAGENLHHPDDNHVRIDSDALWDWIREQLITRPLYVADRTGIAALASLADLPMPRKSPALDDLFALYRDHSKTKRGTIRKAEKEIQFLKKITGAKTLRDLTTDALLKFRDALAKEEYAGWTLSGKFQKIKSVLSFAMSQGVDAVQIRAALDRCKVLVSREKKGQPDPTPVEPGDFSKLLAAANPELRAILLLSLNACLYLAEVLAVEWGEVDLDRGTFSTRRDKTNIRRAATLWPETVEAIRALPSKGESPYVFTSSHGKTYNVNTYHRKIERLATAAGVSDFVFSHCRDGSYTAACAAGVDFANTQLLAGHKLPGQSDHYVSRSPQKVKPACDAVYSTYSPFPASKTAVTIGRPRKDAP